MYRPLRIAKDAFYHRLVIGALRDRVGPRQSRATVGAVSGGGDLTSGAIVPGRVHLALDPDSEQTKPYSADRSVYATSGSRPVYETFLIDREGVIRAVLTGTTYNRPTADEIVDEFLKLQGAGGPSRSPSLQFRDRSRGLFP